MKEQALSLNQGSAYRARRPFHCATDNSDIPVFDTYRKLKEVLY
jgi:hypothetical protein